MLFVLFPVIHQRGKGFSSIAEMMGNEEKLVVWKLDRLARNMNDLMQIVSELEIKGATLEILDQRIDTASGKAFLQMLGVFAEFETNLRKERQAAGIAKAKAERPEAYKGKPASVDAQAIRNLLEAGMKPMEVARKLGVSRATVYRYKNMG